MKEIQLANNKGVVLVDDQDYEQLLKNRWWLYGYGTTDYALTSVKVDGKWKNIRMHRMLTNAPNGMDVDHINHNGLDNQRNNLRICTRQQNSRNARPQKGYTSRFKGVCWDKDRNKWVSHIASGCGFKKIGRFDSEIEAGEAYDKKAVELFGEFACVNFPH